MSVRRPTFPFHCTGLLTSFQQREQTKAIRYVHLLDEARCRADWAGVPELVRKVRKHAPKRECENHITMKPRNWTDDP